MPGPPAARPGHDARSRRPGNPPPGAESGAGSSAAAATPDASAPSEGEIAPSWGWPRWPTGISSWTGASGRGAAWTPQIGKGLRRRAAGGSPAGSRALLRGHPWYRLRGIWRCRQAGCVEPMPSSPRRDRSGERAPLFETVAGSRVGPDGPRQKRIPSSRVGLSRAGLRSRPREVDAHCPEFVLRSGGRSSHLDCRHRWNIG